MRAAATLALFVVTFCAAGSGVSAHGFLCNITINGKDYNGNNPYGNNDPSVIRKVDSPNPNYGASNPALTCGPDELPVSLVADANPGDVMTFTWKGADYSDWPHNTGPLLAYMSNCGSVTCDQFDATQARWFKIFQVGRKDGSADWVQQVLYEGRVGNVTIPSTLAPGNYLLRYEIIALHLATQIGMAEFYPACTQLRVGGNQTGQPDDSELVSFPGAYSDDDPGIYDPDVYDPSVQYVFPGPTIAAFVTGGSADSNSPSTTNPTQTGFGSPTFGSGKRCSLRRPFVSNSSLEARHFRRTINRLIFPWSI